MRRLVLLIVISCVGCGGREDAAPAATALPVAGASSALADAPAFAARLADVTDAAGIRFTHENGASGRKWLPETMGSGVVMADFDGDGLNDLFFVNSRRWPQDPASGPKALPAMYRNLGGFRFEDVTARWGLDREAYGMGGAAGDFDGDGDQDLLVTALGQDALYRNDGARFTDVATSAGLVEDDWGTSATWLDADRDGDLDLFVGHYVKWSPESDLRCTLDGVNKSYCTPESYEGTSPRLWVNGGDGTFENATDRAGVRRPTAKSLGVVAADHDGDGVTDVFVANDTQPNMLFVGRGDGTFTDEAVIAGIAYGETGAVRAGMGIDVGDLDGSGRPALVIGNFSNEMVALYRNAGRGLFVDAAAPTGVGRMSLLSLAFGCAFWDADLDGRDDLLIANGHIEPEIATIQPQVRFAESPHLFRQLPDGRFDDVAAAAGAEFAAPKVARGLAVGDLDGDGDLDVVMTQNGGPARVYRNDLPAGPHWLRLDLGDAVGARVLLTSGGRTQAKFVRGGSSYLSQSERIVTFGLGAATTIEKLEVHWPSGAVTTPAIEGIDRVVRLTP